MSQAILPTNTCFYQSILENWAKATFYIEKHNWPERIPTKNEFI